MNVLEVLRPLVEQGVITSILNNVKDMDKLSSAIKGIRDAITDYQVCTHRAVILTAADARTRSRCCKVYTKRAVDLL